MTLNQDGVSVIDAIGDGVDGLNVRDRVWLNLTAGTYRRTTGTAQEYTNVPATRVMRLPDTTSFNIGACLGVPTIPACARTFHLLDGRALTIDWALASRPNFRPQAHLLSQAKEEHLIAHNRKRYVSAHRET
jgi:NADPH2:quinone reductase